MKKILPVIAITMGDPAGIGPEVVVKLLHENNTALQDINLVVIGDVECMKRTARDLGLHVDFESFFHSPTNANGNKGVSIIDLKNVPADLPVGKVSVAGGEAAASYICTAVKSALDGEVDAVVTAPINKEALNLAGYSYAGHTEMLGSLTKTKDFSMMLTGGDVRVVLVTTHCSVRDISQKITKQAVLKTISVVHSSLSGWFPHKTRIGVAALNPHGGENGLFGLEEINEIAPAILEASKKGILVEGPYPADSLFAENRRKQFDVIIVMYHDQGLIPIKMAAFGKAVNVTLGLPFLRTSVDHGTAFDIVGKGIADHSSLKEAVALASDFVCKKKGMP